MDGTAISLRMSPQTFKTFETWPFAIEEAQQMCRVGDKPCEPQSSLTQVAIILDPRRSEDAVPVCFSVTTLYIPGSVTTRDHWRGDGMTRLLSLHAFCRFAGYALDVTRNTRRDASSVVGGEVAPPGVNRRLPLTTQNRSSQ
jgi:hypothetical protein